MTISILTRGPGPRGWTARVIPTKATEPHERPLKSIQREGVLGSRHTHALKPILLTLPLASTRPKMMPPSDPRCHRVAARSKSKKDNLHQGLSLVFRILKIPPGRPPKACAMPSSKSQPPASRRSMPRRPGTTRAPRGSQRASC